MATRQGVKFRPTGNAYVGVTHRGHLPRHTSQAACRPKTSHLHSIHGGGLKLLRLPKPELGAFCEALIPIRTVIQPGHMKSQDGWLFLYE